MTRKSTEQPCKRWMRKLRLDRKFIKNTVLNSEAQAVLGDQQEKEFLYELAAHKVHKRSALRCSGNLRVQDASPDRILQVKQEDMPEAQAAPLAELEKQLGTGHG